MFEKYRDENFFRDILSSPGGIAVAAIHWSIALVAILHMQVDKFDKMQPGAEAAVITLIILFVLNLPAIIPAAILFSPVYPMGADYFVLVACLSLFTMTFQWLLIGRKLSNWLWQKEKAFVKLEISGESDKNQS